MINEGPIPEKVIFYDGSIIGFPLFFRKIIMITKTYLDAQGLLEDSYRLGVKIFQSGFKPDFIIGIWRGGTPVGIAVQELLEYLGVKTDHISIRTSSYEDIDKRKKRIRVHGLHYIVENATPENSLLIVDDVFDTGLSIEAVIKALEKEAGKNIPHEIRIATAYYKPERNATSRVPDYFIHQTDQWLIFPHELYGLSLEEIIENKPWLTEILKDISIPEKGERSTQNP